MQKQNSNDEQQPPTLTVSGAASPAPSVRFASLPKVASHLSMAPSEAHPNHESESDAASSAGSHVVSGAQTPRGEYDAAFRYSTVSLCHSFTGKLTLRDLLF